MSTIVAIVKSLVGQVFAVSLDGLKRQIFEGERVLQGEQVLTTLGGEVTLQLASGELVDVASSSNWQAGNAEAAEADQAPAAGLEQALAAGFDPTTDLEAPAAGPGTGGGAGGAAGGGGHSLVMLDETGQQLEATVGFETSGPGLAGENQGEQLGALANEGNANTGATNVQQANRAPSALADDFTVNEDGSVSIDARSNDSDLDGDTLTITQVDGQAIAEGSSVTVSNGSVTL
ncbi:retention module-containing protein, partial [Pseudomonas sp.]|uniref:retention module-containing protein n=1 Tax=Pseudomonas sp. TaxID=306 RepID=UPI002734DA24